MDLHEYQAKALLRQQGVSVPEGLPATTPEEAEVACGILDVPLVVVKAQVHAGGRGKGKAVAPDLYDPSRYDPASGVYSGPGVVSERGVRVCHSCEEVREAARRLLGNLLLTRQTGRAGRFVRRVYIEAGAAPERELYAAVLLDREAGLPALLVSPEGGVEIEEVAARTPERLLRLPFDPREGLWPHQARRAALFLGLRGPAFPSGVQILQALCSAFLKLDASLLEINPLAVAGPRVFCLDAKLTLDDNALFRHADLLALRDLEEEHPGEREARTHDLSYVALDGNIGCMVNGAGLALATMDAIRLCGGAPANFLDVGGGASEEKVTAGFRITLSDPRVKALLVNIFGGIMRCDIIAAGILAAGREMNVSVPLIVRLEGNRAREGMEALRQSGMRLSTASTLAEAAEMAARAAGGRDEG